MKSFRKTNIFGDPLPEWTEFDPLEKIKRDFKVGQKRDLAMSQYRLVEILFDKGIIESSDANEILYPIFGVQMKFEK